MDGVSPSWTGDVGRSSVCISGTFFSRTVSRAGTVGSVKFESNWPFSASSNSLLAQARVVSPRDEWEKVDILAQMGFEEMQDGGWGSGCLL